MSVQQQIDRISSAVTDQTTLLDEALALIEGKAAGGGSGGSDASIDTCTVKIFMPAMTARPVGLTTVDADGNIQVKDYAAYDSQEVVSSGTASSGHWYIYENTLCGSCVSVCDLDYTTNGSATVTGGAELVSVMFDVFYVFKAPTEAGATGTIELT